MSEKFKILPLNLTGSSEPVSPRHDHHTETVGGIPGFLSMRIVCRSCQCRSQPDQPDNIKPGKISVSSFLHCPAWTNSDWLFHSHCETLTTNNPLTAPHLPVRRKSTVKSSAVSHRHQSPHSVLLGPFHGAVKSADHYCLLSHQPVLYFGIQGLSKSDCLIYVAVQCQYYQYHQCQPTLL